MLMARIGLYLLLLLSFAAYGAEDSAKQAQAWLEKMAHAVKTLNYEGSFIFIHDDQIEAMRIVHAADADGEHERLISLNGSAREILRDNNLLTCILPDSRTVVVEKSRPRNYIPQGLLDLDKSLSKYYSLNMLAKDRMTGRAAQVIQIKSRDQYRYGYRLWLDDSTGMLLKSDLVNEAGKPIEQMMFTSLHIVDRIPHADLKPEVSGQGYNWFREPKSGSAARPATGGVAERRWRVTHLPPGFNMTMHNEHGIPTSRMPVDHMMFSDGLASVSVYIEAPNPREKLFKGVSHMGAVNAYGAVVSGHQVTVVGEVPKATVMMIGKSVVYQPGKDGGGK